MSKYSEQTTAFKDAQCLADALREMPGITQVDVHTEAVNLTGYMGDTRKETAEIVIPRNHTGIGQSNDIGFKRGADGNFRAVISEYDSRAKFTPAWLTQVKAAYAEKVALKTAKQQGYKVAGRKVVNGQVKLSFVKA